jgi:hypothetical protein
MKTAVDPLQANGSEWIKAKALLESITLDAPQEMSIGESVKIEQPDIS